MTNGDLRETRKQFFSEMEQKLPTSGEIQSVASDKISHSRVC